MPPLRTALGLVVAAALGITLTAADPQKTDVQKILFARVLPNAGQIGLFIAAADGSGEHLVLGANGIDYDPVWSPDGKQLIFVSSRNGGSAHLWTMDLQTRRAKQVTTGAGLGGDFRPSWSPDGQWIAFASDRGATMPFGKGRWEHLQLADIYVMHPNGTGLKRISAHGHNFYGSPKFAADSRRVVAYCMDAADTLETRRPSPTSEHDPSLELQTRLITIDVATGTITDVPAGPGVKFNPSFLPSNDIGFVRKDASGAGIHYTSGKRGPAGAVRSAAWSPDGTRVTFHKRLTAPPTTWLKTFSRNPRYELTLTGILPSFNATGDRFVMTGRPTNGMRGASLQVANTGTHKADVVYEDPKRNIMAPSWSPSSDRIIFGVGVHNLFFNGFNGLVLSHADRIEGGAQIGTIKPDGTG